MGNAIAEQRVTCRGCRYRFRVDAGPGDDWRVEAQCPSCDAWEGFTSADARDLTPPDRVERETEVQRVGELLWRPVNEHRTHPAVAWVDRVGNGVFEDDHSPGCWPVPHWVYRFTRGRSAAYIWQAGSSWFVRGWHPLRGRRSPPEQVEVFSFGAALDWLASEAEPGAAADPAS